MSDLVLKSQRFRQEREGDWKRLEGLLGLLEAGKRNQLSDDDVIALPLLYRATLSSLSMARSISLDRNLVDYLESLSTRAYFFVYGTRTTLGERISSFFLRDWPGAVRALWRETVIAAALGAMGALVAFAVTLRNPAYFYVFVDRAMAGGRGPRASTAELSRTIFDHQGKESLGFFASFLFTHNAQIALLAFALGFACCLPTAFLMFYNGLMLGAFLALFYSHGLGAPFGGWMLIHGVTELFAITLAGAAGFRIGWALAFPGSKSRLAAASDAGRLAGTLMAGVVLMLAVAGLLEGYGRQLVTSTPLRYAIALATAVAWAGYFYAPYFRAWGRQR
jgi:uncharacterized membrane protein SpoIIM required for sporulation